MKVVELSNAIVQGKGFAYFTPIVGIQVSYTDVRCPQRLGSTSILELTHVILNKELPICLDRRTK